MPDRRPDDDSLVRSWRERLEKLRQEDRSWDRGVDERSGVEPPSGDDGGASRRREVVAGVLAFLLVSAVAVYLVLPGRQAPPEGSGAAGEAPVPAMADSAGAELPDRDSAPPPARAESGDAASPAATPSPAVRPGTAAETDVSPSAGPDTAATPELLDLFLGDSATVARAMAADTSPVSGDSVLVVRPGSAGALWVGVRGAEGRPRAGVELVLEGSDRLPGVDERLEVATDGRGRAVFRFPVREVRDTLALDVLARGYWLRGTNRVIVRPVP